MFYQDIDRKAAFYIDLLNSCLTKEQKAAPWFKPYQSINSRPQAFANLADCSIIKIPGVEGILRPRQNSAGHEELISGWQPGWACP